MESIFSSLNDSQKAAVEYLDGPELVIAGAGSGKTRVLTYKVAYLLRMGLKPWNILALTFTNKAAREMKERVSNLVGEESSRHLNMGTFHSIFLRILRAEAEQVGLTKNFTIYDDADSRSLISSIVKELKLDDKIYKSSSILSRIGMAKNNLIFPEAYMADSSLFERDCRSNMSRIGEIYKAYTNRCLAANAVDFDDMLVLTYKILGNGRDICSKYANRFRYILIDEYQDTNFAQQSIITMLTRMGSKICAVGDDAQSIYAFRGANIDNMLEFQNIYRDAKLIKLEQNYRSTQNIVGAANCLISHNERQIKKTVFSENPVGDKVNLTITYSDKEEACEVIRRIVRLHSNENITYSDIAILYRTNIQSRLFEEELRKNDIPYKIYGGISFYQRKEIKDIVSYFRVVVNPSDEEALRRIINYPKRGIGNTTIERLVAAARTNGISMWAVMANPMQYTNELSNATVKKVTAFYDMLHAYNEQVELLDAYVLGKRIVEEMGLSREIFSSESEDDAERKMNIEEFVNGLHDFVDIRREEGLDGETYLANFLQEISLMTDFDQNDGDEESHADNVRLMTVHASKGLEFKAVFIVGMEENLFPNPRSCGNPREMEEERRLFYVALTRAESHCFVSCAKSRYHFGKMLFNEPSRFLGDIDRRWIEQEGSLRSFPLKPTSREDAKVHNRKPTMTENAKTGMTAAIKSGKRVDTKSHSVGIGVEIEHQRFGRGRILNVEGQGENEKAIIEFVNVGTKTLLLKFARFTIVK